MLLALVASIPAFYDSLMPVPASWAVALYLLCGLLVLGATWQAWQSTARPQPGQTNAHALALTAVKADVVLGLALLVCAVLPPSSTSVGALSLRLVVALGTLLRLVVVSKPLFEHAGLTRLMAMAVAVLGLCGIGFYWIDPQVGSLGQGLWLAFSTAATVGFGDVVPSTTASRIFSVFVVLLGYGVLSLVTASIAAMFVGSQERKVEREILREMHTQLRAVRDDIAQLRADVRALSEDRPDQTSDQRQSTTPNKH
jgi:voltage-gated potassium channel